MKIPSGDLAPARKHRRGGLGSRQAARHRAGATGYGRSSRRRRRPTLLIVALLVLALAGGAYAVTRGRSTGPDQLVQAAPRGSTAPTAPAAKPAKAGAAAPVAPSCAGAPAAAAFPAPSQVRFRLLNGSARDGLGMTIADQLAKRGFTVAGTGNATEGLDGASQVRFGPGGRPGASLLAVHVINAELVPVPNAPEGAIDVILGTGFQRLRTPAEVTAFAARLRAGAAPAVPGCR